MFVQINPDVKSYSETFSTLKFAERVSGVELGAARSSKESKDIRDLMEQVCWFRIPRLCVGFSIVSFVVLRKLSFIFHDSALLLKDKNASW